MLGRYGVNGHWVCPSLFDETFGEARHDGWAQEILWEGIVVDEHLLPLGMAS